MQTGPAVPVLSLALLVPPRHQSDTRSVADGRGRIRIGEPNAPLRQRVDIRGLNIFGLPRAGQVGIAKIVDDDQDDVGARGGS